VGKTVGKILTDVAIAAAVVVAIGTGIGIAAGVPLAAALEASVASLGMLTGLGSTIAGGAALAGASALANSVLGPKLPKPDTSITATKGALPPRVRAYGRSRLYGNYDLFETASNGTAVDVFTYVYTRGIPIDGVERVYLGDKQVGTGAGVVSGLADGQFGRASVEIDFRLGAATETAYSQLTSILSGIWTTAHRGDGCVTGMVTWKSVKSKDYQEVYPNGQPPLSLVARWLKVFDWRDGTQAVNNPSTWKWTENAILHLADYILTVEKAKRLPSEMMPSGAALQAAWNRYFAPTASYWTAAANDADAARALKAGGTEPRYRSCVSHKLTDPHKDVKQRIMACADAWLAPRADGALIVYSGRYYAPTVTIGPDEIVSYSLQNGVDDEDALNDITITYPSDQHDYNIVNTTNWTDEADISARGQLRSDTLSDDVPSYAQGRFLAKRKMARAMAPYRGTCTTNSAGRAARGERYVMLDLTEAGVTFFSGPVEITALTRNLTTGGITFAWIAADSNVDAWNPATEEGDPAPVGDVVAAEPLDAPTITSATADFSDVGQTPDGEIDPGDPVTGARVIVVASGPARSDLTWYLRWRVGTSGAWAESEAPDSDPGSGVTLVSGFVPLVSNLNVEVAYAVGDGRFSDYSAASVVDTTVS
jgi:hypothetical protein